MQIVIDISPLTHQYIEKGYRTADVAEELFTAVQKGIPLPKRHGDLKDQKDLAKSLYDYQWVDQLTYMEVTNRLISAPTIIAEDKEQEDGNVD